MTTLALAAPCPPWCADNTPDHGGSPGHHVGYLSEIPLSAAPDVLRVGLLQEPGSGPTVAIGYALGDRLTPEMTPAETRQLAAALIAAADDAEGRRPAAAAGCRP